MKFYILNENQYEEVLNYNKTAEFISTVCDYGLGPCIPEDDVNSPERESFLKPIVNGQIPIEIDVRDPFDPD